MALCELNLTYILHLLLYIIQINGVYIGNKEIKA